MKGDLTLKYIIHFIIGLVGMTLLAPLGPLALIFFVVYILSVRINLTKEYDQRKANEEETHTVQSTASKDPTEKKSEGKDPFAWLDPESEEGRARRRKNYRD